MNIQTTSEQLKQSAHTFPDTPEDPIRDYFLHEDRLRALGEDLAANRVPKLSGMAPFDFQKRIRDNAQKILDVYRATNTAQARGEITTPAAQWLLDNNYLVEETSFQVKRDLPRRFYSELPTMTLPDGTTVPRALAVAWAYVAHTDSQVSGRTLKYVVDGFQATQPMKIGELWALPSLLRFVLVENLRRIARACRPQPAHAPDRQRGGRPRPGDAGQ
jgi:cyclic beta-1,2-glucan synthetase